MDSLSSIQALSQLELFGSVLGAPAVMQPCLDKAEPHELDKVPKAAEQAPQMGLPLPASPLNNFGWTEQDIYGLLERTLVDQLKALNDQRTSPEMRRELIAWVAKPLRKSIVAVKHDPFSFQSCCYAAGLDPEEMQERVLLMFAPECIT